jgi:hypothetical protein
VLRRDKHYGPVLQSIVHQDPATATATATARQHVETEDTGEILISQLAQEDLGRSFSLGEARSLSLKSLAGELAVSPLLWG